jgi:hypothetical protein
MKVILAALFLGPFLISILIVNQGFSLTSDLVYPADSKISGLSYKQWAEKYWQWWMSLPRSPQAKGASYADSMNDTCFLDNNSPVIFLANPIIGILSNVRHPLTYECTISHTKPIFVLGISELCNYNAPREDNPNQLIKSDAELQSCVHVRNPYARVEITVDNESIKIPSEKRENTQSEFSFTTDFFNITIPKGSIHEDWGIGINPNRALLDEKAVILKPLSVGDHMIQVKVVQIIPERSSDNLFLSQSYKMYVN